MDARETKRKCHERTKNKSGRIPGRDKEETTRGGDGGGGGSEPTWTSERKKQREETMENEEEEDRVAPARCAGPRRYSRTN